MIAYAAIRQTSRGDSGQLGSTMDANNYGYANDFNYDYGAGPEAGPPDANLEPYEVNYPFSLHVLHSSSKGRDAKPPLLCLLCTKEQIFTYCKRGSSWFWNFRKLAFLFCIVGFVSISASISLSVIRNFIGSQACFLAHEHKYCDCVLLLKSSKSRILDFPLQVCHSSSEGMSCGIASNSLQF